MATAAAGPFIAQSSPIGSGTSARAVHQWSTEPGRRGPAECRCSRGALATGSLCGRAIAHRSLSDGGSADRPPAPTRMRSGGTRLGTRCGLFGSAVVAGRARCQWFSRDGRDELVPRLMALGRGDDVGLVAVNRRAESRVDVGWGPARRRQASHMPETLAAIFPTTTGWAQAPIACVLPRNPANSWSATAARMVPVPMIAFALQPYFRDPG